MIISMKLHSTKEEIEQVCERIRDFGYKIHAIEGEERVVIGAVGTGDTTTCLESVEAMPQSTEPNERAFAWTIAKSAAMSSS
jgi:3-deoxy-7-phosphoheptulonate synthase